MSVIVKGMKFPENCLKCDLRGYDANAGEEYCPFTQIVCLNIGRQDACPLQELPEKHGRLIDAEALIDTLEQAITIMETMLKQLDLEDDDNENGKKERKDFDRRQKDLRREREGDMLDAWLDFEDDMDDRGL